MAWMAFFSSRETWAWEMPTSAETSIWVLPSQKRRARIRCSRSSSRPRASFRAMRSIYFSSVFRRSLTWSMTQMASPPLS